MYVCVLFESCRKLDDEDKAGHISVLCTPRAPRLPASVASRIQARLPGLPMSPVPFMTTIEFGNRGSAPTPPQSQ
eukprot:4936747-Amphidinium_carterae.1